MKIPDVTIKIIDRIGGLKKVICKSNVSAGIHEMKIFGSDLPSGIYYFTLEINGLLSDVIKIIKI